MKVNMEEFTISVVLIDFISPLLLNIFHIILVFLRFRSYMSPAVDAKETFQ